MSKGIPQSSRDWLIFRMMEARKNGKYRINFIAKNYTPYADNEWVIIPVCIDMNNNESKELFSNRDHIIAIIGQKYDQFLCEFLSIEIKTFRKNEKKYGAIFSPKAKQCYFLTQEDAINFITNYIEPIYMSNLLGGK